MMKLALISILLSATISTAHAQSVTVESCAGPFTYDQAPERAVSLNQSTTEIMLALGLEDRMVGTAYLDDEIPKRWQAAYKTIPVLAERFPAQEVLLSVDPDFLFAGFSSAFSLDNLGDAQNWRDLGIGTYLVDSECEATNPNDRPLEIDTIYKDIAHIGKIFRIEARAEALIQALRTRIETVRKNTPGRGETVFLYDSGTDLPYSVGCCGGPAMLLRTVGLESVTAGIEGAWASIAWEAVVSADPDYILLIDASWSSADDKRAYLEADPVLSELQAVKNDRILVVPFSQAVPALQFADGVENLAGQLRKMQMTH